MGRGTVGALLVALAMAAPAWSQSGGRQLDTSTLKMLDGIWGLPDCSVAAPVTVFGDKVQFHWPGKEQVVEQVTSIVRNRVATTLVSPAARRGELYEYEVGADRLLIRNVASGRESILVRCARPSG